MRRRDASILLVFFCLLAACAAPVATWRARSASLVMELGSLDAPILFPQEYHNLVETFEHGEAVLHVQGDIEAADTYYLFALQKGELLRAEVTRRKEVLAEEERRLQAEQSARAEEKRRLDEQERLKILADVKAENTGKENGTSRENSISLPLVHTVRRGETLPQIAARTEIYNNASLWPIIYRANRDQIRDPKRLWPGQVLKIPRHFSRDEALEARRYSGKK